jgi:hypothetical protein
MYLNWLNAQRARRRQNRSLTGSDPLEG